MEPQTTIAARLGAQPFTITPADLPDGMASRAALKTYAVKCGASWREVKFLDMASLRRAYCERDALAELLKIDRDTAGAKGTAAANASYMPRTEEDPTPRPMPGPLGASFHQGEPAAIISTPAPAITTSVSATTTAAAKLQEALATLAAGLTTPLDEERVIALIHQHAPKAEPRGLAITVNNAPPVIIDNAHAALAEVLTCITADVHIAIVGPAGTGKTELAAQVAKAMNRPFFLVGAMDSPYRLTGFIDAQGRYQRTAFRDAFENGGVCLFDEADAGSPAAFLAINAALANGHCDFPDGNIKRHPDFVAIIAANTYGRGNDRQYVGRTQLDAATLDRFAFIPVDYDEDLEMKLAANAAWVRHVQRLRANVRATGARIVISMRASISGAKLLAAGLAWERVAELVIWKGIDADTRAKIESGQS